MPGQLRTFVPVKTSMLVFMLAAMSLVACTGNSETVEVSGTTGLCAESEGLTVCDATSSDERVAGTTRYNPECELSEVDDTTTGDCSFPITMTNDGGTWEGTCAGTTTWSTSEPAHVHKFDCTYLGTGDYEGLRYVVHVEGTGDYPWPTTGRIESAS